MIKGISDEELARTCLADIRDKGWSVAVHNDYWLGDERWTFWLFTKGNRCAKGEGRSDLEALILARDDIEIVNDELQQLRRENENLRRALAGLLGEIISHDETIERLGGNGCYRHFKHCRVIAAAALAGEQG